MRSDKHKQKAKRREIDLLPGITFGLLAFIIIGMLYEFIMSAG